MYKMVETVDTKYISDKWQKLGVLGSGLQGLVLKVINIETQEICAMKITLDENIIPPKIYQVQKYLPTNGFADIILECYIIDTGMNYDNYIDQCIRYLDIDYDLVVITIHEFYEHKFNSIFKRVDQHTRLGLAFECIYGLSLIHAGGVVHGDIHSGNIMLTKNNPVRTYNINGKTFVVRSQYRPVFIDFGMAETPDIKRDPYINRTQDWGNLAYIVAETIDYNLFTIIKRGEFGIIPPSLLWDSLV